jgi:hypothetical protein
MKRIISLNESDLARIVRRVINERSLLTEGVPNTTLKTNSPITIPAREICKYNDYIRGSVILQNVGPADAYLISKPLLQITSDFGDLLKKGAYGMEIVEFNTTIKNIPIYGNPEGDNQSKIPKGKSATLNFVIKTNFGYSYISKNLSDLFYEKQSYEKQSKNTRSQEYVRLDNLYNHYVQDLNTLKAAIKNLKANFTVKYNGQDLSIPITFEGFTVAPKRTCDAKITLAKGF